MAFLTALAIGTAIAGTVVSAVGAKKQATAQKKAGQEQQRIAEENALQAERDAMDTRRRGVEEVNMLQRVGRKQAGTAQAGYAAQGVDVSAGTPQAVQRQGEALLRSDLDRVRRNAEREALGFESEAKNYRLGGQYARAAANAQARGTILGGIGNTLAGGAAVASSLASWDMRRTAARTSGGATSSY